MSAAPELSVWAVGPGVWLQRAAAWKNQGQWSRDMCTYDMGNTTVFWREFSSGWSHCCTLQFALTGDQYLRSVKFRTVNSSGAPWGEGLEALTGSPVTPVRALAAEPPVLDLSGSCCRNLAPCLSFLCSLLDTLTWHLKTTRASTWSSQRQH